ncbi:MAG: hypothetical protein ACJ75B_15480 [Flavisolibacter sp.]
MPLLTFSFLALGQDSVHARKFLYYPHSSPRKWNTSVGITGTTMPYEITEEIHYRIPAADLHVQHSVSKNFKIDGRLIIQAVQNLVTIGPRLGYDGRKKFCFNVGDDVGYWFGFLNIEGFKTKGHGWQNSPNASVGYVLKKNVLLTLKAEAIMVLDIKTYAGEIPVTTHYNLFSGSAYTFTVEQPFFGNKSLVLGFRALYTSFFWQTWVSFTSFDRNLFYPQLIVGVIL